ncbi:MAG: hypothetical protein Q8N68_01595 [bacterium]|nr:hypothetical protein [bacterium]
MEIIDLRRRKERGEKIVKKAPSLLFQKTERRNKRGYHLTSGERRREEREAVAKFRPKGREWFGFDFFVRG